ncbi:hypothetical protein [Xanthomonas cannabis]|uniref:Competence protein n=1 Tax=Xanthomonas cannabis TaxID=1885674 RepID=A0ABR6JPW7_9XANT|nr:hypothetical protein [Xanthomonas cannabis]MBB4594851.1 hypothetical protein [Xanthomonas cannabis]MBB5523667.1 hypothetical protein [Xanthomonas cannabis]
MRHAYRFGDPLKQPVTVEQWLVKHRSATPMCLICGQQMALRGVHAQTTAHFVHGANSNCPTITRSHAPYKYLSSLSKSPGAASAAKKFVKDNLYGVYYRMRALAPGLTWTELLAACEAAKAHQVWDLVGMTPEYAPSVLLTCVDSFPATSFRPSELSFFLEPNPSPGAYWNFPQGRKRQIFVVDRTKGQLSLVDIDFTLAQGDIFTRIEVALS